MPRILPNLLATRFGRLAAFFLLYVTEGIPLGFTATAIATYMRRQGLTPAQIGVFVGTLYLPWAWKWVVGPIVDTLYSDRLGRRRGWILVMQLLLGIGLVALMPINYTHELRLFTIAVLFINAFGATQDVAIDALAVSVLSESERGVANGMMFAGAYVGQTVGGAGVLLLATWFPFQLTYIFVAGCILLITIFVVLPMREPVPARPLKDASESTGWSGSGAYTLPPKSILNRLKTYAIDALESFVGSLAAIAGLIFAFLPAGAQALSLALQSNLAVELHLTDAKISLLAAISTITSAIGCIVGGYLSDLFGRRRMISLYIFCTALPTLWLAWVMHRHGWILPRDPAATQPAPASSLIAAFWAATIIFALFQGLMYGTRTALFMDICNPAVAATQFTAYMAILNLVVMYSASWQGFCAEKLGYPITLTIDAIFGLVGLAALPFMSARRLSPEVKA